MVGEWDERTNLEFGNLVLPEPEFLKVHQGVEILDFL